MRTWILLNVVLLSHDHISWAILNQRPTVYTQSHWSMCTYWTCSLSIAALACFTNTKTHLLLMAIFGSTERLSVSQWVPEKLCWLSPLLVLGICLSLENDLVPAPFEVWCQSSNHSVSWPAAQHSARIFSLFLLFLWLPYPRSNHKGSAHTIEPPLYQAREQTSQVTNRRGRIGGDTCVGTKIVSWLFSSIQEYWGAGSASTLTVPLQVHFLCSEI